MDTRLIYGYDLMCSWCWGFEPVRKALFSSLPCDLDVKLILGGLASDSVQPMPDSMQLMLQQTWKKIQETIPGTEFNFEFWNKCQPRRSTYPSNRAVIAARKQGKKFEGLMILRIQRGYYLQAKNPSDKNMLLEFARDIELDVIKFEVNLDSQEVHNELINEIRLCRELGLNSFPSLAMQVNGIITPIAIDYLGEQNMLNNVEKLLAANTSMVRK